MNKYSYPYCHPKKKKKKRWSNKKIGIIMMLLGVFTVLALFLPMKYWIIFLSMALVVFGIMLMKSW